MGPASELGRPNTDRIRCNIRFRQTPKILSSGAPYDNRFISVITIENRTIINWRGYKDSLAAWSALNSAS
jgi:ketosteroid isomerase-like protein